MIVVERLVRVGEEMVEGEGMNCRHLPVPDRQTVRMRLKTEKRKICGKSQDKFFGNKLSTGPSEKECSVSDPPNSAKLEKNDFFSLENSKISILPKYIYT